MQTYSKILLVLAISLITSCSNYSQIKGHFINASIDFPQTKKNETEENILKVKLRDYSFAKEIQNSQAKVNKEKTFVLPLILFTSWHHATSYQSGNNSFSGDIINEFKTFLTDILSNHQIKFVDEGEDIEISLKVNAFDSKLTYHKKGDFLMLLFYISSMQKDYSTINSKISGNLIIHTKESDKKIPISSNYHGSNLQKSSPIEKVKVSLHHNMYDFSIKLMEELKHAH